MQCKRKRPKPSYDQSRELRVRPDSGTLQLYTDKLDSAKHNRHKNAEKA